MVELLLTHHANPNVKDQGGETPLMEAARWGRTPVVKLLLAHRADQICWGAPGQPAWAEVDRTRHPEPNPDTKGSKAQQGGSGTGRGHGRPLLPRPGTHLIVRNNQASDPGRSL